MKQQDWRKTLLSPTWAEVDLDAIGHNVRQIAGLTGPSVKLYAALKGDAYGYGCVEVARAVVEAGAYGLAFANLYECVRVREAGLTAPILLYAGTPSDLAETVVRHQVTPTITDLDSARPFSECAPEGYGVFVKIDCGLDRAGTYAEEALPIIEAIMHLPRIRVEGIYTHLEAGSGSDDYAHWQFSRFITLIEEIERAGIHIPVRLAASSPYVVKYPEMYLNAIDPGYLIFGLPLEGHPEKTLGLQPAFRALKSRIIQTKATMARDRFSEDASFDTGSVKRFAVLPVGWGDGLHPAHGNGGPALVRGKRTSVLGAVNYEHCKIDLTAIPEAEQGDEVVLVGRQGEEEITMEEVAQRCRILPSQVAGSLSKHMPVVYFRHGEPCTIVGPTRECLAELT